MLILKQENNIEQNMTMLLKMCANKLNVNYIFILKEC